MYTCICNVHSKNILILKYTCICSLQPQLQKRKNPAPRGRPRNDPKYAEIQSVASSVDPDYTPPVKRGRGRPRKYFPVADNSRWI